MTEKMYGPGPKADPVEKEVKKWIGKPPTECDLCHNRITEGFVDGVVRHNSWANMCLECHAEYGVGLGMGRGQMYKLMGSEWVKVAG